MLHDRSLRMATQIKCHTSSDVAFLVCVFAVFFQAVICQEIIRGDGDPVSPTEKAHGKGDPQIQIVVFPSISPDLETSETPGADSGTTQPNTQTPDQTHSNPPQKNSLTSKGKVVCVDKIQEHYRYDVLLKLKASSTCEETRARIQSVLEHLCGEDCELKIYQKDNTDEVIIYGDSIDGLYRLLFIFCLFHIITKYSTNTLSIQWNHQISIN
ncbi:hypothetical protein F2P79_003671 [Pimephales promelas]|nr:hypothetical protein F2P79_003671 [Pimephales promelas]KAG1963094.1 hypothetical protein F2P79_003671 [Pimephales promelas]